MMKSLTRYELAPGRILRPKQYVQILLGREYQTGVVDKILCRPHDEAMLPNHVFVRVVDVDNGFNDIVYVPAKNVVTGVVTRG